MRVIEVFDRGVRVNPRGTAFISGDGSGRLSYAEVDRITHRVAAALHRDGVLAGTPVAVLSPNTPVVFPFVLGLMRAGCAWVALNTRSSQAELGALLTLVGARVLFYSAAMTATAQALLAAAPSIERAVVIDGPSTSADSAGCSAADWLAPPDSRVPLPPLDPEGIAAYFGTGGTTGAPKAVEVPHRAMETMIHGFYAHMPERWPVNLVAAPLTHAAGAAVFPVLGVGGTNVIHNGVSPVEILESIERNRVTRLFLPPTAIYSLLACPDISGRDLSSLRYLLYGAAPMSVEKLKEAMRAFGPVMAQFYGQVELPMLCTFLGPEEHASAMADPALERRLASCGRNSLVANVAIMNDEGAILPNGEPGEIVVRSSLRMAGYHRDPAQTQAVRREGDWQATGDVGYMDEDGYIYIVDRKRDLIISGGFNIFPSEIEQVIWSHPAVEDCAVIGLPDEKWGERVAAMVELKRGAAVDPADLIAFCRKRLAGFKVPKAVVLRELPRSPVGKVLKRSLRDEYWAGRERMV